MRKRVACTFVKIYECNEIVLIYKVITYTYYEKLA